MTIALQTNDEETQRIEQDYFPLREKRTTSQIARTFDSGGVTQKHRQKSWIVETSEYDSRLRALQDWDKTRVRHVDGVERLGAAIIEMFQ